ncbi:hypothetical protein K523DRAFT_399079 [Schizophyllum commune Tattone D]|nr:hypothetical protein K523DRAFT_399079 [Schizophyllum commune Tattone D]
MTSFCDIFCPLPSLFNVEVVIPEDPSNHQDAFIWRTPHCATRHMARVSSLHYLCLRLLKQHLAPLLYSSKRGDHNADRRKAPGTYLGVNPIATVHPQAGGIPTGPRYNDLRNAMGTLQTSRCLRGRAEAVLAPGSGPLTNSSESDHDHPNIIGLVRRAVANRHGLSVHVMCAALARDDYHNRPTTSSASPHDADPC